MTGIREVQELASTFRVLYVEDDTPLRDRMGGFLSRLFGEVVCAADGREGLRRFGEQPFDLVITELKLPRLSGLEMIAKIRAGDGETPIITTTRCNDSGCLRRAIELNVCHYLLKPLDRPTLIKALFKTLRHRGLERKIHELTVRIRELLNVQTNLVVVVQGEEVTTANQRFLDLFGVKSLRQFNDGGFSMADLLVKEEGFCHPRAGEGWVAACMAEPGRPQKAKLRDPLSGDTHIYLINGAPLPGPEEEFVLSFTDISEVEAQYRALQIEASTDPLTKLSNWLKFHSELDHGIHQAHGERRTLGMILVKPDDFSTINDRYGYHTGDQLVIELAKLIESHLTPEQKLARLSGVEFGILCPDGDPRQTQELAERLNQSVQRWPFSHDTHISCSFGIATLRPEDTLDELFNRGDQNLIRARRQGGGRIEQDHPHEAPQQRREQAQIRALLHRAAEEHLPLLFFNTYKGLGISGTGTLVSTPTDAELRFKIQGNQAKAMGREAETTLSCELLPMRVCAHVAELKARDQSVALDALHYTPTTAMNRSVLRIQPREPIPVEITEGERFAVGAIVDVSLKALAVDLGELDPFRLGADVELAFKLPTEEGREAALRIPGRVLKLNEHTNQAIIALFANQQIDSQLRHYLSLRQLELVHELQSYAA